MNGMVEYFNLFIAHLLGDALFCWRLKDAKRRSLFFLGVHSAIYAIIVTAYIYLFMNSYFTLWKFILLLVSHFIIDYWKCYIAKIDGSITKRNLYYTFLDQFLHLLVLIIIVVL